MPLTRIAADAFSVVTICLVAILLLLGLLCIAYSFYFRSRINRRGFVQLSYFSGPWIIRIAFILFAIWWGLGEIIRLSLLGRGLHLKWQQTICKCYIVSNLGFAEPCLFLTLVFLLRAPLQTLDSGIMNRKWNGKTAGYILLCCFPVFVLQLFVVLVGPQLNKNKNGSGEKLPHYFTSAGAASSIDKEHDITLCTYPLLSTLLLGLFAIILTSYLFWLGNRILKLVINKGLQKRIYTLILSVSGFLPLRVLFLGLSVLSGPEHFMFEAFVFLGFLALVCCAGVCMCMLVYRPVADSLALGNLAELDAWRLNVDCNDTMSLIAANQGHQEDKDVEGNSRYSDASTKGGSISFQTLERDRDRDDLHAHTLCGHEYVALEDFENGIKCYQSALMVDSRHYKAWYGLGMLYLRQEKLDLSEHHFRMAFQINPRSSVILSYLGTALHALKRSWEALAIMEKAILADKKNPLPMYQKASILISLEKFDEALDVLEELKECAPRESSVYALMGNIYRKRNMHERAMFHYGVALDLKPSATDAAAIKAAVEKLHIPDEFEDDL